MNVRTSILLAAALVLPSPLYCRSTFAESQVKVVDEQGKPIANFEAMVNTADQGCSRWEKGENEIPTQMSGLIREASVLDLLVRADGYANTIIRFQGETREELLLGKAIVTLQRGQQIELRLKLPEGMTWPKEWRPEIYFADIRWRAALMRQPSNRQRYNEDAPELDFNMRVQPTSPGNFQVRLNADTPPFYVAIHQPGFLQFFEAGPFTMADVKDGVLEVHVPRPAQLKIEFQPSEAGAALFAGVNLMVLQEGKGGNGTYLEVASQASDTSDISFSANDLAPGEYFYKLRTKPKPDVNELNGTKINPGQFNALATVTLQPGAVESANIKYVPPDLQSYRGDRNATLRFLTPDGKPASDKPLTISYADQHYSSVPVFTGVVPTSGDLTLDHLTAYKPKDWPYAPYSVRVGTKLVGFFGFSGDEKQVDVTFRLPPEVGDLAPDVDLVEVGTGRHSSLSERRGKVVWLEFWATWCGPCQMPMQELVEMAGEHAAGWNDQVVLLPLSIDDTREAVARHVKDRAWDRLPHFWAGADNGQSGFSAAAANAFGVNGVPMAFLIGRDGRILWTGHPKDNSDGKEIPERIATALEK